MRRLLYFSILLILFINKQDTAYSLLNKQNSFEAKKPFIVQEINLNIPNKSTITFTQVPRGIILSVDQSELFENQSCTITENGTLLLKEIAKLLENFNNNCTIEAHTEENILLNEAVNEDWELSIIRANAIAEYFKNNTNIETSRIFPIGFGHIMPFKDNVAPKDFSNNRIDFVIFDYTANR